MSDEGDPGPRRRRRQPRGSVLRVDPVACDGVGMCAHLAAGVIALDPWGYPLLPADPVDGRAERAARAAVAGCPRQALFLE